MTLKSDSEEPIKYRIRFRRSSRIDPVEEKVRLNRFFAIFEKRKAAKPGEVKEDG